VNRWTYIHSAPEVVHWGRVGVAALCAVFVLIVLVVAYYWRVHRVERRVSREAEEFLRRKANLR